MSRIVNELDSIHFSMKKASQLVKELGRQVISSEVTDMLLRLFHGLSFLNCIHFSLMNFRLQLIDA